MKVLAKKYEDSLFYSALSFAHFGAAFVLYISVFN